MTTPALEAVSEVVVPSSDGRMVERSQHSSLTPEAGQLVGIVLKLLGQNLQRHFHMGCDLRSVRGRPWRSGMGRLERKYVFLCPQNAQLVERIELSSSRAL